MVRNPCSLESLRDRWACELSWKAREARETKQMNVGKVGSVMTVLSRKRLQHSQIVTAAANSIFGLPRARLSDLVKANTKTKTTVAAPTYPSPRSVPM